MMAISNPFAIRHPHKPGGYFLFGFPHLPTQLLNTDKYVFELSLFWPLLPRMLRPSAG